VPIKSKAQFRFLEANHPEIAKRWLAEYPTDISKLPKHVKKRPAKKKKKK